MLVFMGCQNDGEIEQKPIIIDEHVIKKEVEKIVVPTSLGEFSRDEIKERLLAKIEKKEDLFVHVFVPLCDNEHQGIVPVNKSLGDGFNPHSNLYWGALYGVKTHLKNIKIGSFYKR